MKDTDHKELNNKEVEWMNYQTEESKFRQRSELAQEVLTYQPGFLEKRALMVFILIILLLSKWSIVN